MSSLRSALTFSHAVRRLVAQTRPALKGTIRTMISDRQRYAHVMYKSPRQLEVETTYSTCLFCNRSSSLQLPLLPTDQATSLTGFSIFKLKYCKGCALCIAIAPL